MSKSHTPGPWEANGYDVRQPRGRYIAYCGPSHTPDDVYPKSCKIEDEANARIIAAAPELLNVLEDIIHDTGTGGYWWGEKALAAIAKAKGEPQK